MFLLKRATTVVLLMTIFGILLPDVYIQPAHADGEIQAAVQGEHDAEAQPGQGLKCYKCGSCEDGNLGIQVSCTQGQDSCVKGHQKKTTGTEIVFRSCAHNTFVELNYYSCDTYKPSHDGRLPGDKIRLCFCKGDLCNGASVPGPRQFFLVASVSVMMLSRGLTMI